MKEEQLRKLIREEIKRSLNEDTSLFDIRGIERDRSDIDGSVAGILQHVEMSMSDEDHVPDFLKKSSKNLGLSNQGRRDIFRFTDRVDKAHTNLDNAISQLVSKLVRF